MISDDDLLLYYYRDGLTPAERTRIGAALAEQPELAQRLHRLVGRLDAAAAVPEVPVPEAVQQRWRAALDQAAQGPRVTAIRRSPAANFQWLAAAAVLLVAIVSVFQFTRQPAQVALVTPPPANAQAVSGAYERGLKQHLASTEQQLAAFERATPEERARLVETIIGQNRRFALAAERAGEPQLARVLRAFTPVLESAAREGGDTSASVSQLAFELRVMQGRLGERAAKAPSPNTTTL